jgi:spore germination cell wall hydrolase CwlJ-like protein
MIKTVRAAAFAVVALAVTAGALTGGPVQAWQGEAARTASYTEHASADAGVSDLGLNDDGPSARPAVVDIGAHSAPIGYVPAPAPRPSLDALVGTYAAAETDGAEQDCLANAVYFEARGESLEGQLAVAEVVMNRAASGRYPATLCGVVVQPAQFSFVRRGNIPAADRASEAWRRAVAIARIAGERAARVLPRNVLWYHANYVSPSWGRRLARNTQIGLHIFYS